MLSHLRNVLRAHFNAICEPITAVLTDCSADLPTKLRDAVFQDDDRPAGEWYGPDTSPRLRMYTLRGQSEVVARFDALAREAGQCVKAEARKHGIRTNDDHARWIYLLFHLATVPDFPMRAHRTWLHPNTVMLQLKAALGCTDQSSEIPRYEALGRCDHVDDIARASVYAIDILTADTQKAEGAAALPQKVLSGLPSYAQKAYVTYNYAETYSGLNQGATDKEFYDWLLIHRVPQTPDFVDYELPDFLTWSRYLRMVRKKMGTSKHDVVYRPVKRSHTRRNDDIGRR